VELDAPPPVAAAVHLEIVVERRNVPIALPGRVVRGGAGRVALAWETREPAALEEVEALVAARHAVEARAGIRRAFGSRPEALRT
jgi:hypothetical protein